MQSGVVPASVVQSNVCLMPKKGDPAMVDNYRPISQRDNVFERLVFKHPFNHIQDNHLLSAL